jgi:hypothetical protein
MSQLCLTFTVSGGLEGLAEAEVRRLLSKADESRELPEVGWKRRGNSGSQLAVYFPAPSSESTCLDQHPYDEFVKAAMWRCRYVEYAYLEVLSTIIDDDDETKSSCGGDGLPDLLHRIHNTVALGICTRRLSEALKLGHDCQNILKGRDVGLEKLPGMLLPTPACKVDDITASTPSSDRGFVVNTIYTKEEVAKVVVEGFTKLVHEHFGTGNDDSLFVDAGTGSGALLRNLPSATSVGVDTHPNCVKMKNVLKADFLQLTRDELQEFTVRCGNQCTEMGRLCIVSNPPFSDRSRGDYSAIISFINKAVALRALCIGVIVPTKFARERVWASLGMDKRIRLLARFLLPNNCFFDPASGKSKHISSIFLFFGIDDDISYEPSKTTVSFDTIHIIGKRDKRFFPEITTAELSATVARGLEDAGAKLASSEVAEFLLSAEIKSTATGTASGTGLQLDLLLNPKRPLSLTNSISRLVPEHSLGWMSSTCKPPVARAMVQLATESLDSELVSQGKPKNKYGLIINAMSGEGTIEIEAQAQDVANSFFIISGDSDASAALHTKRRLTSLAKHSDSCKIKRPRVDVVVWDAQRLPLRRKIADAYLADMPFCGSKKKVHQAPCSSGHAVDNSLDYKRVMGQAVTVLKPGGRAVFLSADAKAMGFAGRSFNWSEVWQSNAVNVGGLSARMSVMERGTSCYKDLSTYVSECCGNLSESLLKIARDACAQFYLDDRLALQDLTKGSEIGSSKNASPVILRVELFDTHLSKDGRKSNGYRFYFDDRIANSGAKQLFKIICDAVGKSPPDGMIL